MGNYVIAGVGNYVIENPSDLGNFMIADNRPQAWRDRVEVVAMDGFTGFKTAAAEELPDAVAVMDPFHVVRVRHEVSCLRMEVRDLHRLVVAAAGLKLRAA